MKPLYLSIDLGGTSLRIALLDAEAQFLAQRRLASDLVRLGPDLLRVLSQELQILRAAAAQHSGTIQGLALGIPGLVDHERGIVHESPHFPAWRNLSLKQPLHSEFRFPVFMDNDANQAALGEAWKGAAQSWSDFILITLGTGVGGGIVSAGKVFHGPSGFAGEIGHIVIERHGLTGAIGSRGTLETLTSQSGLRLQLKQLLQANGPESLSSEFCSLNPDSSDLPEALDRLARAGNPAARQIWRDFGAALGCGIASLANAFGFSRFVVGGGLAAAWDHFITACQEEIHGRMYATTAAQLELVPAKLGNDAGLIGGVRAIQLAQ